MPAAKVAKHETRKIVRPQATPHNQETYQDELAVEEPLEIRIHDQPVSVTMRTPGDDYDLAAGFLFTEGILRSAKDIGTIRYCPNTEHPELRNIVNVTFAEGVKFDLSRLKRNFYTSSSCGICGKAAIELVKTNAKPTHSKLKVRLETLYSLSQSMRKAQTIFDKTGGLHAAGIFDAKGTLRMLREDVGRHNAVDKSIGAMLLTDQLHLENDVLMVSGRASFEIMQKALMARIPVVCAVSAPTSLAVEFARECGMTLIGFLRGQEMNVYTGAERIEV